MYAHQVINMEIDPPHSNPSPSSPSSTKRNRSTENYNRWKNPKQQQIYSSNLLSALQRVRRRAPTSAAVRAAADRALAEAARGRSRWSRALLSDRKATLRIRKQKVKRPRKLKRFSRPAVKSMEIERKVRVLGRLVPGCEKLKMGSILEETEDYIAALEVQVKAMKMLADFLSVGSSNNQS